VSVESPAKVRTAWYEMDRERCDVAHEAKGWARGVIRFEPEWSSSH
jgi:hypothetical protein